MANDREGRQAADEERGIELVKQMLLPSILEDMEAAPKLLIESAGESCCCIFRAPQEACRPRVISIGPYHFGEPQLERLEGHKWRYLHAMLDRLQPHGIYLEHLINVVEPKEKPIRQCYSASTDNVSGRDLVKMMVLDGCFIVEFLRQNGGYVQSDEILSHHPYFYVSVVRDLLRLENQVPYFVLEELFEITNVSDEMTSLTVLAFKFFDGIVERPVRFWESNRKVKGVHLLDLLHLCLVKGARQNMGPAEKSSSYGLIGSASKLSQAGISFVQRKAGTLLEIDFDYEKGIMHIPKLTIDATLQCLLPNMVAFEQCSVYRGKNFTAYAMCMAALIDTADDAQLLRDSGVMWHNGVNKEGVASFLRDVCKDALWDPSKCYLEPEIAKVNRYVKNQQIRIFFLQVINALCHSAWTAIASIVMLTGAIEAVYVVLEYYRHK